MLLNPPTKQGLNDVALTLHFSAWDKVTSLITEFENHFPSEFSCDDPNYEWKNERKEYVQAIAPELEVASSLIQHANELALKARLCSVSPYLLLVGSDARFSEKYKNIQFSDLRTINAVDLPGAVNNLTPTPVSQSFIVRYNKLRVQRNKITHLGITSAVQEPEPVLHELIELYSELWPDRAWLRDQVDYGGKGSTGFFDDGRHWSVAESVYYAWEWYRSLMTSGEYKKLFGTTKSKRTYICFECFKKATTKWSSFDLSKIGTAHLCKKDLLKCLMCEGRFKVSRIACSNSGCPGDVIGVDIVGYIEKVSKKRCHTCHEFQP